jgi:hypothetical protein
MLALPVQAEGIVKDFLGASCALRIRARREILRENRIKVAQEVIGVLVFEDRDWMGAGHHFDAHAGCGNTTLPPRSS